MYADNTKLLRRYHAEACPALSVGILLVTRGFPVQRANDTDLFAANLNKHLTNNVPQNQFDIILI